MTGYRDEGFEGIEFDTPLGSFRAGRGFEPTDADYRVAKRRVRKKFGFFRHVATYMTVLLALLALDLLIDRGDFFVHWVAIIWGVIVALHFLNAFVFDVFLSREAESRMIERELRKRGGSGQ